MFKVIDGIAAGDRGCIALGVDLLEEDAHFAFGRSVKPDTARALRHVELTEEQRQRIRRRVMDILKRGQVPRGFAQYARLLRRIGLADFWPELDAVTRDKPFVKRWRDYLLRFAGPEGREAPPHTGVAK